MRNTSLGALLAVGLLAGTVSSASAADLGGNCCADLEERVADLEATTARKGNRKVSLTVTGWVSSQVTDWDDGKDSGTYISDLGATLTSNVKFQGEAQIVPGWKAGYLLHLEFATNDPLSFNQDKSTAAGPLGVAFPLQSYWFIESKDHGRVSVGQMSHASDNAAILPDGSGSLLQANWVIYDGGNFFARSGGVRTAFTWGGSFNTCAHIGAGIGGDCNGVPRNAVRYDSPTYSGFSLSAGWGQDKFWDVTGRYAGEHAGFKLAMAASYSATDDCAFAGGCGNYLNGLHSDYFQFGGYAEHIATGLFVYGAYGHEFNNGTVYSNGARIKDDDRFFIKAGVRATGILPLGHTVFWGEYGQSDDQLSRTALATFDKSNFQQFGFGILQEVDSAAMSMWIKYRNNSADASCVGGVGSICTVGTSQKFDDFHAIVTGAIINF